MHRFFTILLTIGVTFITLQTYATEQYDEILIDGKDTVALLSYPLEKYFENKRKRSINGNNLEGTSTACYRGYRATWQIQNDSLYLICVSVGCNEWNKKPKFFNLKKEFGSNKVFAKWFSGTLVSPRGNRLFYSGFTPIHEEENFFEINIGKIVSTNLKNYLTFDPNLLYPSTDFLNDTLKKIIYKSLDLDVINKFSDSDACGLQIVFNEEGGIKEIRNFYKNDGISFMEESILNSAKAVLENLPKLMKVTHQSYRPPAVLLHFSGHCLKFPWDKEYGCTSYKQ